MYSQKEVGINVKNARRHRSKRSGNEFTIKGLATKIGETTKWVKKLERGEVYPEWDALNFIADVCGVEVETLIGEKFEDEIEYEDAIKGGRIARNIKEEELSI